MACSHINAWTTTGMDSTDHIKPSVCMTCKEKLCTSCKQHHKVTYPGHRVQKLNNAFKSMPAELKALTSLTEGVLAEMRETLELQNKGLESWYKEQKSQVNERVKDVINSALRWKRVIEKELDDLALQTENDIGQIAADMGDKEVEFTTRLQSANKAIGALDSAAFDHLATLKELSKRIGDIRSNEKYQALGSFSHFQLQSGSDSLLLGHISNSSSPDSSHSINSDLIPKLATHPASPIIKSEQATGDSFTKGLPEVETMSSRSIFGTQIEAARKLAETQMSTDDDEIHVAVNFNNDVVVCNANKGTMVGFKYHKKQYNEVWRQTLDCSGNVRGVVISPSKEIGIRVDRKTIIYDGEGIVKNSFKGPYGDLLAMHDQGYVYGHAALRTGRVVLRQYGAADHARGAAGDVCSLQAGAAPGLVTVTGGGGGLAVLDTSNTALTVYSTGTGGLVSCVILPSLPDHVISIAVSGLRLFILDHLGFIHVYCTHTSRCLTIITPADLGLDSRYEVRDIWTGCVCLLHVLCVADGITQLVCYDLTHNTNIWKK